MIKTNSKLLKTRIQKVVTESVLDWLQDNRDYLQAPYNGITENAPFSIVADLVLKTFHDEKLNNEYNRRLNRQEVFTDWLQGLAGIVPTDCIAHGCTVDFLGGLLDQSEKERAKYSEMAAIKLYSYLIYRECVNAAGFKWLA